MIMKNYKSQMSDNKNLKQKLHVKVSCTAPSQAQRKQNCISMYAEVKGMWEHAPPGKFAKFDAVNGF